MDKLEFLGHFHSNNQEEARGSHGEWLKEDLAVKYIKRIVISLLRYVKT